MTGKRYKVVSGSQSKHCCFEYTVVDTTKPLVICDKHFENEYEALCECFDKESAHLIAYALHLATENLVLIDGENGNRIIDVPAAPIPPVPAD